MTDIIDIIDLVIPEYKSAGKYHIEARFYPYKNVSHTIRIKNGTILIRLSDKVKNAPDEILKSIIIILMDKLFRIRTSSHIKKNYKEYVSQQVAPNILHIKTKISPRYKSAGRYFNLDELFAKVDAGYFSCSIKKPVIGWSLNKSVRRLGFYDHDRDLLVISKVFDHKRVPGYVVEYIMYHEMLHILHPLKRVNGRRVIHSKQFMEQEILFKEYTLATRWLNKKLWRLNFIF